MLVIKIVASSYIDSCFVDVIIRFDANLPRVPQTTLTELMEHGISLSNGANLRKSELVKCTALVMVRVG